MSLETQIQNASRACEEFNSTYPIGTRVKYWKRFRSGEPEGEAATRTTARVVSAFPCVWLEGVPCGIQLKNIEPVVPDQQPFDWVRDYPGTNLYQLLPEGSGILAIAKERQRQIKEENWTPEHDDAWQHGEMADAAYVYLNIVQGNSKDVITHLGSYGWPWDPDWFKPFKTETKEVDRIRCLEKAGALIAAEIDRLKRAGQQTVKP